MQAFGAEQYEMLGVIFQVPLLFPLVQAARKAMIEQNPRERKRAHKHDLNNNILHRHRIVLSGHRPSPLYHAWTSDMFVDAISVHCLPLDIANVFVQRTVLFLAAHMAPVTAVVLSIPSLCRWMGQPPEVCELMMPCAPRSL
jgi:hypothetical protein